MWEIKTKLSMLLVFLVACLISASPVCAQNSVSQRHFESPQAAAEALVAAARDNDEEVLIGIFGRENEDIIGTVDKERDRELRARFAEGAEKFQALRPEEDGSVTLIVGYEAWAFPVPLVRDESGWRFDSASGREEILTRRIGVNELDAIETLRTYVKAQRQYAEKPRDGTGVRKFARKIRSTPGNKDGLYWDADRPGAESSPFGPLIADGGKRKAGDPYNGYYFRILTRQGPDAPGGAYSYIINGNMVAGFAMTAYPADYGSTGIMTFIVNHYGDVYQKDLGPPTAEIASKYEAYNPDPTWTVVED